MISADATAELSIISADTSTASLGPGVHGVLDASEMVGGPAPNSMSDI